MTDPGHVFEARSERERRYVEVVARTSADGLVTPLEVRWEDGRRFRFRIDRMTDRRRAASLKAGGASMRYTVRIQVTETYLFFDDHKGAWFVEAKREPGAD